MCPYFLILLLPSILFTTTLSNINIRTHGPIEYCNIDPYKWNFTPLKPTDIKRIEKLIQLHVLARHGTRILPIPITDIFPNSNQSWNCNFSTVITRHFKNEAKWMAFKLHFVKNEEIVEGSCAVSSSLAPVIKQHTINAKMITNFYIGKDKNDLMTKSELRDIAAHITYINMLGRNDNIPELKVLSADYERTITSATIFMSEFLDIHDPKITLELYTHDIDSDPYTPQSDKVCKNILGYIIDNSKKSKAFEVLMKSNEMIKLQDSWFNETGLFYDYSAAEAAILMYCGSLDVELYFLLVYTCFYL